MRNAFVLFFLLFLIVIDVLPIKDAYGKEYNKKIFKNRSIEIAELSVFPNPFSPARSNAEITGTVTVDLSFFPGNINVLNRPIFLTAVISEGKPLIDLQKDFDKSQVLFYWVGLGTQIRFQWNGIDRGENIVKDGQFIVTVIAWNPGLGFDTKSIEVKVDQTAPQIVFTSPQNGFVTGSNAITVSGSVNEEISKLTVQGKIVLIGSDLSFSDTVNLIPGPNTIEIVATDLAGNVKTQIVNVTYDNVAPLITVTSLENGSWSNLNNLRVEGTVDDLQSRVWIGGHEVPVSETGTFSSEVSLSMEVSNVIVVQAEDPYGNRSVREITVNYDGTPPELRMDPSGGIVSSSLPALLISYNDSGIGVDLSSLSILMDGSDWTNLFTISENQAQYNPTEPLSEGDHSWTATLKDNAGNESSSGGTFTIQTVESLTVDSVLEKVEKNYRSFQDMFCRAILTIYYNGEIFTGPEYMIVRTQRPNRERAETYTASDYQTLSQTSISSGGKIQVIYSNGEKAMADLGSEVGISQDQMDALDVYFNLGTFKSKHIISIIEGTYDQKKQTVILKVIPNESNQLYDRIDMRIDLKKGIIEQWDSYQKENIVQTMKVTQSSHINNQVWLPTKVEKISPMYDDATLTAIMEYSDVKINQGLNSSLFEFQE